MNEQIKQLYIQAINDTKHDPADDINIQIAEKFAELIVKECIEINKQELSFNAFERLLNKYQDNFGIGL